MSNNRAIGVFDSGMGGLSVLKAVHESLPLEHLIYLADTKYIPYGEKEAEFIIERCIKITDYFLSCSVKALVIACNTATAAASVVLRERYPDLPIIGMEPAVKPATQATHTGRVGVLATSGTLKSAKFAALLDRFAHDVTVIAQPCPGLVECIEAGDLTGTKIRALLHKYLQPMLDNGCDTIILGCTHYPFLRPLLTEILPAHIQIIDTGAAVARYLQSLLMKKDVLSDNNSLGAVDLITTGNLATFNEVANSLWTSHITSSQSILLE